MGSFKNIEILMVEDNPADADLTLRALKKRNLVNSIYNVTDGEDAVNFVLRRGVYDGQELPERLKLILLDLKLPKLNGFEVLKVIRQEKWTKKVPVVILTSSREDPDIAKAYELGANSYVVKPVNFENFSECVSNLGMYWMMLNEAPGT